MIFELLTKFWEHVEHLIEFLLADLAHHGVTFWSNTGTPGLLSDQRILTEECSCLHASHKQILVVDRVLDVDLTLSIFHDVESLSLLSLIDQRILRIQQLQIERFYEEVYGGLVFFEDAACHALIMEDELDHSIL